MNVSWYIINVTELLFNAYRKRVANVSYVKTRYSTQMVNQYTNGRQIENAEVKKAFMVLCSSLHHVFLISTKVFINIITSKFCCSSMSPESVELCMKLWMLS